MFWPLTKNPNLWRHAYSLWLLKVTHALELTSDLMYTHRNLTGWCNNLKLISKMFWFSLTWRKCIFAWITKIATETLLIVTRQWFCTHVEAFFENVVLNEAIWWTIFYHVKHLTAHLVGCLSLWNRTVKKKVGPSPQFEKWRDHCPLMALPPPPISTANLCYAVWDFTGWKNLAF